MTTTVAKDWAAEQSANTRRQIVLAAMRLMAEQGIEGVSLRAVNVEAGARNCSAAHYHFGDKLGLVKAIVDTLADQAARWRKPQMDRLRARAAMESITIKNVLEASYLPFYGFFYDTDYGLPALKFLSRLIVDTGPDIRPLGNRFTGPLATEVYDVLQPMLPHIPPKLLKSRILFTLVNLINGASDVFSMADSPLGDLTFQNPYELASEFLDYLEAGISAPPRALEKRFEGLCTELIGSVFAAKAGPDGNA